LRSCVAHALVKLQRHLAISPAERRRKVPGS
jgi:hypothetical protein